VANLGLYAASKNALNAWFGSYAQSRTNTRFVTVISSMIDTPMLKGLLGERYIQFKDKMIQPHMLAEKLLEVESSQDIKSGTEIFVANPSVAHSSEELLANKLFWEVENR
jgi:NAD(P)-dependent dehydrogenase (short-subunit alcohol dehydrogenase family)